MRSEMGAIVVCVGLMLGSAGCMNPFGDKSNQGNNAARNRAEQIEERNASAEPSAEPKITADTRFAAGQLAESQGYPERAIEQYREAIKVNPMHEQSLYRLGVLLTRARIYGEAVETWRQLVKATNGSANAYSNLGFCCELAGQGADAETAYQDGIRKEPSNQACRVNYGLFLARTGRADEAVAQLSAVLQPAEVHYNLGSVYEQTGRSKEARAEYEKALQLDPNFWEAQSRLAKLK